MSEQPEKKRYWERSSGSASSKLMMGFILAVIVMLVVVSVVAGYGYIRYRELSRRPEIHVERGLFEFHREGEDDTVNITAHVTMVNRGDKDSGPLELEYMVMPADRASENIFISQDRFPVDSIDVDESIQVSFNLTLSVGNYRIAYRSYEDEFFSYEARQTLRVREDDIPEDDIEDEYAMDEDMPFVSAGTMILIIIITAIVWRKKYDKR